MDVVRGGESEAMVARFLDLVASFARRVVERPQEPVRVVIGHSDGVGMVKS